MSACSWLYCQEKTPKESVLTPTGFPFLAETWISNRASLLASRCLVCVALSLSLSLALSCLRAGRWQLARRFFVMWSFWGLETRLCVWMCVMVFMLDKKRACLCACPGLHFECVSVCVRADFCMCVAEQQNPGCHSAAQLTVVARLNGSSVLP